MTYSEYKDKVREYLIEGMESFHVNNNVIDRLIESNENIIKSDYEKNVEDFRQQADCKDMSTWASGTALCLQMLY